MIGQSINKYRIIRQIGRGGMGEVYEALHEGIGQRVAIKLLHPAYATRPEMRQRFSNEARAVHLVQHPGLVKTLDFGHLDNGTPYMIMEFLDGESLGGRLRSQGALPLSEALRIARQVASALAATHRAGIIHRDLKPDNVILVDDPEAAGGKRAKLLDFGIAKLRVEAGDRIEGRQAVTESGALMGTPLYMSPEQCRGAGGVDDRTDVYALGVMLFQMISGETPFVGLAMGDLMVKHIMNSPPKLQQVAPGAPEEVEALVKRMLAKEPAERPAMAQVTAELELLGVNRAHTGPVATPHGEGRERRPIPSTLGEAVGDQQQRPSADRWRWLAAAAGLALCVVGGTAWVIGPNRGGGTGRDEERASVDAVRAARQHVGCELTSVPSGAVVLRADGTVLGETPWWVERERGSGPLWLLVRLAGHQEQRVMLDPAGTCRQQVVLAAAPASVAAVAVPVVKTKIRRRAVPPPGKRADIVTTPQQSKSGVTDEDYQPKSLH